MKKVNDGSTIERNGQKERYLYENNGTSAGHLEGLNGEDPATRQLMERKSKRRHRRKFLKNDIVAKKRVVTTQIRQR